VLYAGPVDGLLSAEESLTARALQQEDAVDPRRPLEKTKERMANDRQDGDAILIRGARANNLRDVDVRIPKGRLIVVTGVSGSGKSSLVGDVLEAEARRRFLETLSLYERQRTQEGPEAPVDEISGLGVAVMVDGGGQVRFGRRNTVGLATELSHHLAVLFAWLGERDCPACDTPMVRAAATRQSARARRQGRWRCPSCETSYPVAAPRHFSPSVYAAACTTCHGVGTLRAPNPDKLIIHPEKPLCGGAMYSPGFFPKGYLCKPMNGGYELVQALAEKMGFDPATTPWNAMSEEAQRAFLYGYPEELRVVHQSRNGSTSIRHQTYPGFYGWVRDWDTGGTYTDTKVCPDCGGARLRPEYAAVTLVEHTFHELTTTTLARLAEVMEEISVAGLEEWEGKQVRDLVYSSLGMLRRRLCFLLQVGLGYLDLDRDAATLSAGEAQRVKLAGLLGSGLTSLTVLVDEPTRGMHPSEVDALVGALQALRDEGSTVILVEHDLDVIRAADHLIDMGPGAGREGGAVVASGTPAEVARAESATGRWLRMNQRRGSSDDGVQKFHKWMTIRGARANNLRGGEIRLPLGAMVGICGVSGSGKSTLVIDTLGRALAPKKQTTSVAHEPVEPGAYEAIEGTPKRTILVDQVKAGMHSPASFLRLTRPLHALFAESEDARALGLDAKALGQRCSACNGRGIGSIDMGFLPTVYTQCEVCRGTGYRPEAWEVRLRGVALPELFEMTLDEVYGRFGDDDGLAAKLGAALDVGLGYLVLRQPGHALSGGEAQRLKIARELCRRTRPASLYILDEPTVGQHLEDVARLNGVLRRLVDEGHTVLVVEHHPHVLAACDWLIELGPGGGPAGGRVVATGTPKALAYGSTPTAPHLQALV
jgi:excinuclease ABC subunit A